MKSVGSLCIVALFLWSTVKANLPFTVELKTPHYVLRGDTVELRCIYDVKPEHLSAVKWLKDGMKIFHFEKERNTKYRMYQMKGATIDRTRTDERRLTLTNVDFAATGMYSCEAQSDMPIFSRQSNEEFLTVVQVQDKNPEISGKKDTYKVGDWLELNCTSGRAKPPADITWLVNGEVVDDGYLRTYPKYPHRVGSNLATTTVTLTFEVEERHAGEMMELSCISTIPAFLSADAEDDEYVDKKQVSFVVEVVLPPTPTSNPSRGSCNDYWLWIPITLASVFKR